MPPPIRVFLGSGSSHFVEETVFAHSLVSTASRPIEVWMIDCSAHVARRFGGDEHRRLPDRWRSRLSGATAFSLARFGAPELCDYEGRAIYCESDQLALGDICELWDHDLGGAALAAVPFTASRHPSPFQTSGYLSSVMLLDNSRCATLDIVDITERIDRDELTYLDAISMTDAFVETYGLSIRSLRPRWNDLQVSWDDTAILHFTDRSRRPWLHPALPDNDRWVRNYLSAIDAGLLDDADLASARGRGSISLRVRLLPRLPRWSVHPVDHQWQRVEPFARRIRRRLRRQRRERVA